MKRTVFPEMAFTGIGKNRKLYLPYIFSCIGMVMMSYIVQYISVSPAVTQLKGGNNLSMALSMGKFVIAVFALIFLFYTNSFLIRRRNREFGLYSILGVDKRGLVRILTWESLTVAAVSITAGLVLGIVFSKLAELALIRLIRAGVDYSFPFSYESLVFTLVEFAVIFVLIYIKSVVQILRSNPLALMKSEHTGEKAPKANFVLAVAGAVMLAAAYFIAVKAKNPISTLVTFLIAVITVIAATYMLFISGSVALCRVLTKNKKYYYKKNHFVSVSSMTYRMKRNGAGLASVCILSTMVLVMIASSSSLFFGAENSMNGRYPRESEINIYLPDIDSAKAGKTDIVRDTFEKINEKNGVKAKNVSEYICCSISGIDEGNGKIHVDPDESFGILNYDNLRNFYFITQDEYNLCTGENLSLLPGEAAISPIRCKYDGDRVEIEDLSLKIREKAGTFSLLGEANASAFPSVIVIISDYDELKCLEKLEYETSGGNTGKMLSIEWHYSYDLGEPEETVISVYEQQLDSLKNIDFVGDNGISYNSGCRPREKNDFYITFGGLFFIGIILSAVFILAEVMIIYYKQISEGYEDRERFEVMRKVGMTSADIKKSINSQMLTVFLAPLAAAGLHFSFAFPPIWKILQLFNLNNLRFVILISLAAFAVFGICYAIIYKVTAGAYYKIVSTSENP